ncbi:MAG: transglycosylase SLT domain-containing protein [Neorhizobium sp.]|nr:transglycosylase SLT domain-containing protein [Neorhizobium sp.]
MAVIRFIGRGTAAALMMSSALAGCSSVERDQKMASAEHAGTAKVASAEGPATQFNGPLPVGNQPIMVAQGGNGEAQMAAQPTVALTKTGRIAVPVPAEAETSSVQSAAMASPTMAPILAFKPQTISAAVQPPVLAQAQPLTQAQVAAQGQFQPHQAPAGVQAQTQGQQVAVQYQSQSASPASAGAVSQKSSRLLSPPVAQAVASGQIQPAAAQAIALDEPELTPDMVALQHVIPLPRPDTGPSLPAPGVTTLAYAGQPKAVSAISAIDRGTDFPPAPGDPLPDTAASAPPELKKLIHRYAGLYGVPESLVHRVVHRESKYDPKAYHKNGYWGLMQIRYATAKAMGYQGPPKGLLDAETNLKYAIKYLRGAWLVADNKNDNAIQLYARGYYYDAKRKDMLDEIDSDQRPTAVAFSMPVSAPAGIAASVPAKKPGS